MKSALLLLLLVVLPCAEALAGEHAGIVSRMSARLPETPSRIVTLGDLSTELVLALGFEPVGAGGREGYRRQSKPWAERLDDTRSLGSAQQPNLEALIALKPDLIIGSSSLHQGLFERLDRLAPTVLYRVSLAPTEQDAVAAGAAMLRHLAQLTGREERAEAVLAEMHAALAEARQAAHESGVAEQPLAVLYPLVNQGLFIVSNEQTLVVSLANRLGGSNPWPLRNANSIHKRIDIHALAGKPDLNLFLIGGYQGASMFETRLWRALPVAKKQRYGFLETRYWSFGGPGTATVLVRQMSEVLRRMGMDDPGH